ncbi:hypothetical protein JXA48_01930 [Candidatus Woesearchaeota archaeon]|nr:hypothetical protein [Candidatus Woesearchaeota archaeon]
MKLNNYFKITFMFLVVLTLVPFVLAAAPVDIEAGHSYYVELDATMGTLNWAGAEVSLSSVQIPESRFPITAPMTLATPMIWKPTFPGGNFADDHHYFAAMFPNQFDLNNVHDMTPADLAINGIFSAADYPQFYPDYLTKKDAPDKTLVEQSTIMIGGQNYTSYRVLLVNNIYMHVLKYEESPGVFSPLFLVKLEPATCFTGASCFSEFLLPVSSRSYNFYALSDLPQYSYRVWIDGVETNYFPQTGLPHELTFEVTNIFTDSAQPNAKIFVGEEDGQNLFLPKRLSGYVTEAFSVGSTDASGMETFIVTPTKYGTIDDYKIHYGVFFGTAITSPRELNITSSTTLVQQKKTFTQPGLTNNLKVAVNAMNSISDYLYRWADSNKALMWGINYDVGSGVFTTYDDGSPGPITLKTGAVNVIDFDVKLGAASLPNYQVRVKEGDGYLVMNPYTGSSPLTQKTRSHYQVVDSPTQLIVTPTTYNDVSSTISVDIIDPSFQVINTYVFAVDANLEDPVGSFFSNNLLKTISVAMKQILSSMFYSLN